MPDDVFLPGSHGWREVGRQRGGPRSKRGPRGPEKPAGWALPPLWPLGGSSCPHTPAPPANLGLRAKGQEGREHPTWPKAFLLSTTLPRLTNSSPVTKPAHESGFSWSKSGCVRVSFRSYPVNVTKLETWLGAPGCGQAVLHSLKSEPDVHFGMTLGGFRCWKISYQ